MTTRIMPDFATLSLTEIIPDQHPTLDLSSAQLEQIMLLVLMIAKRVMPPCELHIGTGLLSMAGQQAALLHAQPHRVHVYGVPDIDTSRWHHLHVNKINHRAPLSQERFIFLDTGTWRMGIFARQTDNHWQTVITQDAVLVQAIAAKLAAPVNPHPYLTWQHEHTADFLWQLTPLFDDMRNVATRFGPLAVSVGMTWLLAANTTFNPQMMVTVFKRISKVEAVALYQLDIIKQQLIPLASTGAADVVTLNQDNALTRAIFANQMMQTNPSPDLHIAALPMVVNNQLWGLLELQHHVPLPEQALSHHQLHVEIIRAAIQAQAIGDTTTPDEIAQPDHDPMPQSMPVEEDTPSFMDPSSASVLLPISDDTTSDTLPSSKPQSHANTGLTLSASIPTPTTDYALPDYTADSVENAVYWPELDEFEQAYLTINELPDEETATWSDEWQVESSAQSHIKDVTLTNELTINTLAEDVVANGASSDESLRSADTDTTHSSSMPLNDLDDRVSADPALIPDTSISAETEDKRDTKPMRDATLNNLLGTLDILQTAPVEQDDDPFVYTLDMGLQDNAPFDATDNAPFAYRDDGLAWPDLDNDEQLSQFEAADDIPNTQTDTLSNVSLQLADQLLAQSIQAQQNSQLWQADDWANDWDIANIQTDASQPAMPQPDQKAMTGDIFGASTDALQTQLQELRLLNQQLEVELNQERQQRHMLTGELSQLREDYDSLSGQQLDLSHIEAQLHNAKQLHETLELRLQTEQETRRQLEAESQALQAQLQQLHDRVNDMDRLQAQIDVEQHRAQELQRQLNTVQTARTELENRVQNLTQQVDQAILQVPLSADETLSVSFITGLGLFLTRIRERVNRLTGRNLPASDTRLLEQVLGETKTASQMLNGLTQIMQDTDAQTMPLPDILNDVIASLQPHLQTRRVRITMTNDSTQQPVYRFKLMLRAFYNVLYSAAYLTPADQTIDVHLSDESGHPVVKVSFIIQANWRDHVDSFMQLFYQGVPQHSGFAFARTIFQLCRAQMNYERTDNTVIIYVDLPPLQQIPA